MSQTFDDKSKLRAYLALMLKSPLTTWWGAATALIEILGFALVSDTVTLSKLWLLILLFFVSFSLFMGFLVLYKGWTLYSGFHKNTRIVDIIRVDNEQVFILEGSSNIKVGSMYEVYRISELVEVPIGFIEARHQREDGMMQAKLVWIMPGHLRDIETHEVSVQNLKIYQILSRETLQRWVDEQAERRVDELMRRGRE